MTDDKRQTHLVLTGRGGGGSGTQVQADWNQTDTEQPDYIKNKPTILTQWFGTQAEYDAIVTKDPNVIYNIEGSDNVQADWNQSDSSAEDYIKNKPSMSTETLTFTLQGGTTVTLNVYVASTETMVKYFYVEDISGSANTLSIVKENSDGGDAPTVEIFYSTDGNNWESMGSTDTTAITATIPANGKLYLKSTNNGLTDGNDTAFTMISASGSHNIGGNIMSLIAGDNFENAQPDLQSYFKRLFKNDTALVDASALVLPTTATTACYAETFSGCTSLTTTPVLQVAALSGYCYYRMFEYCTNLNSVTTYAQDISAENCINNWLDGVSSTGDFYNLGGATFASGVSGIPEGWTEHNSL